MKNKKIQEAMANMQAQIMLAAQNKNADEALKQIDRAMITYYASAGLTLNASGQIVIPPIEVETKKDLTK